MNIYQRVNEVRKAVPYIQKDKEVVGGGSYKAVTHDAVTAALRDAMIEHGIVVVSKLADHKVVDTTTVTKGGIPIIRFEAVYNVSFVNADDPTDKIEIPTPAHALDNGDKAPGKATSYATKYAMLKLFSIETGEEEEGRVEAMATKKHGKHENVKPGSKEEAILKADITPLGGAWESVHKDRREAVRRLGDAVLDYANAEQWGGAYEAYTAIEDQIERAAVYSMLDKSQRKKLTAIREQLEAAQA